MLLLDSLTALTPNWMRRSRHAVQRLRALHVSSSDGLTRDLRVALLDIATTDKSVPSLKHQREMLTESHAFVRPLVECERCHGAAALLRTAVKVGGSSLHVRDATPQRGASRVEI